MNIPPEGLWRYPPTRVFLTTAIAVFSSMWLFGYASANDVMLGRAISIAFFAIPAAIANAMYVEAIIVKERGKPRALELDLLPRDMKHPTYRDQNADRT